jgi:hypothetical protein
LAEFRDPGCNRGYPDDLKLLPHQGFKEDLKLAALEKFRQAGDFFIDK